MTEPQIIATFERVYMELDNKILTGDKVVAAAILTKLIHETVYKDK